MDRHGRIWGSFAVIAAAACYELPEFPTAPPTAVDWGTFDEPTVLIEEAATAELRAAVFDTLDQYAELCGWDEGAPPSGPREETCATLERLLSELEEVESVVGFEGAAEPRVQISGVEQEPELGALRLASRCSEGGLTLRSNFTKRGLGPVVWGGFDGCRIDTAIEPVVVDGQLRIDFLRTFRSVRDIDEWVRFELNGLTLSSRDGELEARLLHMRWRPNRDAIQIRFSIDGDDGVIVLGRSGVAIIDSTTVWACSFEAGRCERGDRVVEF